MCSLRSWSWIPQRFGIILLILIIFFLPALTAHADDSPNGTLPNSTVPSQTDTRTTIYLPMVKDSRSVPATDDSSQTLSLGVYIDPGFSLAQYRERIDKFEQLMGKGHAIYHFYTAWPHGGFDNYQKPLLEEIVRHDATPMISFMSIPADGDNYTGCGDPNWNLDSIINGSHDDFLHQFAQELAAYEHTVLMRWGHEMNLNQYSWAGFCNGGRTDKFILAYRHIVDLFRQDGADNAKWIWSPIIGNYPPEAWNDYRIYYPGDDYVDWIGMIGYNFGASSPYTSYRWATFDMLYATMLNELAAEHPGKPVMLADYGSVEDDGGDKAEWIRDAFQKAKEHENLRAMVWFNYAEENTPWPTGFRIESSEDSIAAYQLAISDPYFVDYLLATP